MLIVSRFEAEYWLPPSRLGPSRVPKIDAAVVVAAPFAYELSQLGASMYNVQFLNRAVDYFQHIVLAPVCVEDKLTLQAVHQLVMSMIASARYTAFLGLTRLSRYAPTELVTPSDDRIGSSKPSAFDPAAWLRQTPRQLCRLHQALCRLARATSAPRRRLRSFQRSDWGLGLAPRQ